MKSVLMVLAVSSVLLVSSATFADYGNPYLPNWSSNAGYTSQFWGLHTDTPSGLAPDNYSNNPYGTASATWVDYSAVGWNQSFPGTQPSWLNDGLYGGNPIFADAGEGPFTLTVNVPTGSVAGTLDVYVQYDWYNRVYSGYAPSTVTPSVAGATDVTPAGYSNIVLAHYNDLLLKEWDRTTKVFEFATNPGTATVTFTLGGFAPGIDSFSITTALNATIPTTVPTPEPATMAILSFGALGMLLKKRAR